MKQDTHNDGGPAFPAERIEGVHNVLTGVTDFPRVQYAGMSLRDWFAGQALHAVMGVNPDLPNDLASRTVWPQDQELARRRAAWAYLYADAMLAARGNT